VARKPVVKLTANFERNLEDIEHFLTEAVVPQAFDSLLDELLETVIPNLERYPDMGRPFLPRQPRSVEATNALATLRGKLSALIADMDALREYVLKDYLLLYAQAGGAIYLLAIRHQRQLSFDFEGHWRA
jgi:plasmid stabilization system protein ParE